MNSRQDLIKAILRYSNEYTEKKLAKIPDDELIFIKLKAEKLNPALKSSSFQRQFGKGLAKQKRKKR